jgi:DNA adenine methylase
MRTPQGETLLHPTWQPVGQLTKSMPTWRPPVGAAGEDAGKYKPGEKQNTLTVVPIMELKMPKMDHPDPPVPTGGEGSTDGKPATPENQAGNSNLATTQLISPLKWHGVKDSVAKWIVSLMPPRVKKPHNPAIDDPGWLNYVEPFFGSGAVLLALDPHGISECVNDVHGRLTNFWRVLQDEGDFARFQRIVEAVPFSEVEWNAAAENLDHPDAVRRAAALFIRCRQSLNERMDWFDPLIKERSRRGMNEQVSDWKTGVEGLPAVHARLSRVVVRQKPALEVIRYWGGRDTLLYVDPPHPDETTAAHRELLDAIRHCTGKVMLRGSCPLCDRVLFWNRHKKIVAKRSPVGRVKTRTEFVWCNY